MLFLQLFFNICCSLSYIGIILSCSLLSLTGVSDSVIWCLIVAWLSLITCLSSASSVAVKGLIVRDKEISSSLIMGRSGHAKQTPPFTLGPNVKSLLTVLIIPLSSPLHRHRFGGEIIESHSLSHCITPQINYVFQASWVGLPEPGHFFSQMIYLVSSVSCNSWLLLLCMSFKNSTSLSYKDTYTAQILYWHI